jgi:hypothetical protein
MDCKGSQKLSYNQSEIQMPEARKVGVLDYPEHSSGNGRQKGKASNHSEAA